MDEIAAEYDVVVLGTGRHALSFMRCDQADQLARLDGMRTFWVELTSWRGIYAFF